MRLLDRIWMRFRSLFRRDQTERELSEEFEFHLERQIQENLDRGMPPAQARVEALRIIGGIAQLQEECRDMRRVNYIEALLADIRYAMRGFRRQPGFSALAILTLALGIGASTALFSLVNAVRLRPLPVNHPETLAMLWESDTTGRFANDTPAPANFADWRAQNRTFEDIAAGGWVQYNLTGYGEPERLTGLRVTANYFTVLGVKAALGRLLAPGDDNLPSGHVAVISYDLWQRRFGADPNLPGRVVNLNGDPSTIVGVGPPGFEFPSSGASIWVAPGFTPQDLAQRSNHFLFVTGRRKAGVSWAQARADLAAIARRLEQDYPRSNTHVTTTIVPLREYYAGDVNLALNVLLAAAGALLLIVCADLAHLFLARGAARRKEIAMRAALGAGRGRVIRQLLTECAVLSSLAAALGAALSTGAFQFLARLIPGNFPTGTRPQFDLTMFAFTAGIALVTALLFGIAPAIQASKLDLTRALKLGSGRSASGDSAGTLQATVIVTEVGLTVMLLIAAGLMLESYRHVREVNTGFRAENALALETTLPSSRYNDPRKRSDFYNSVVEQASRLPGVISAGYVTFPPLSFKGGSNGLCIEGRPKPRNGEAPVAYDRQATPGYFQTIGVPLLRGRMFDQSDGPDAPRVLLINQAMARAYWPNENPVGAGVRFGECTQAQFLYTVIGVVGDVSEGRLETPPTPEMYFPAAQNGPGGPFFWPRTLVVRTAADPWALAGGLRRVIAAIDPDQPVANIRTLDDVLTNETSGRQTQTVIVSTFAIVALLLAFVGLYGVLSYTVAQRRPEIGIRMALGARRGEVVRGVMSRVLAWSGVGVICGVAGALALTRTFSSLLFHISPFDAATFAAAVSITLCAALVASFVPARRAAAADPMSSLRQD